MIKLIYGHERAQFPQLIDSMHRLRKSVFHERLKWDVPVSGDWEIDDFDSEDPLYVLVVDAQGEVQGSLRLLPTTGPNMLRDVFSAITQDSGHVENPFVWESSRFCIRFSDNKDQRESTTISKATVELIAGMGEVGLLAGLDHVVTVYDAFLRRIIRQTGCNETLVGQPVRFGRVQTYAGLFDIDAIQLAAFKRVWNLADTLIDQDSRSRLFAAA
jgi:acyl homoserine lactone synthase